MSLFYKHRNKCEKYFFQQVLDEKKKLYAETILKHEDT